jgi:hypothetical protein
MGHVHYDRTAKVRKSRTSLTYLGSGGKGWNFIIPFVRKQWILPYVSLAFSLKSVLISICTFEGRWRSRLNLCRTNENTNGAGLHLILPATRINYYKQVEACVRTTCRASERYDDMISSGFPQDTRPQDL